MKGYTKGEWSIKAQNKPQHPLRVYTTINSLEYDIADIFIAAPNHPGGTEANAQRIVNCVNGCEGINPKAVKGLYEALKVLTNFDEHGGNGIFNHYILIQKAKGALAEAEKNDD